MEKLTGGAGQSTQSTAHDSDINAEKTTKRSKKDKAKKIRQAEVHAPLQAESGYESVELVSSQQLHGRSTRLSSTIPMDTWNERLNLMPRRVPKESPDIIPQDEFGAELLTLQKKSTGFLKLGERNAEKLQPVTLVCSEDGYIGLEPDDKKLLELMLVKQEELFDKTRRLYPSAMRWFPSGKKSEELTNVKKMAMEMFGPRKMLDHKQRQQLALTMDLVRADDVEEIQGIKLDEIKTIYWINLQLSPFVVEYGKKKVEAIDTLLRRLDSATDCDNEKRILRLNYSLYLEELLQFLHDLMQTSAVYRKCHEYVEGMEETYDEDIVKCGNVTVALIYRVLIEFSGTGKSNVLAAYLKRFDKTLQLWVDLVALPAIKKPSLDVVESWHKRIVIFCLMEDYNKAEILVRDYNRCCAEMSIDEKCIRHLFGVFDSIVKLQIIRGGNLYDDQLKLKKLIDFLRKILNLANDDIDYQALFAVKGAGAKEEFESWLGQLHQCIDTIDREIKAQEAIVKTTGQELIAEEEKQKLKIKLFHLLQLPAERKQAMQKKKELAVSSEAEPVESEVHPDRDEQFLPGVDAAINIYLKSWSLEDVKAQIDSTIENEQDPFDQLNCHFAWVDILWHAITSHLYKCQSYTQDIEAVAPFYEKDELPPRQLRHRENRFKDAVLEYASFQEELVTLLPDLKEALDCFEAKSEEEHDASQLMRDQVLAIRTQRDELIIWSDEFCIQCQRIRAYYKMRGDILASKNLIKVGHSSEQSKQVKDAALKLGNRNREIKQYSREIVASERGQTVYRRVVEGVHASIEPVQPTELVARVPPVSGRTQAESGIVSAPAVIPAVRRPQRVETMAGGEGEYQSSTQPLRLPESICRQLPSFEQQHVEAIEDEEKYTGNPTSLAQILAGYFNEPVAIRTKDAKLIYTRPGWEDVEVIQGALPKESRLLRINLTQPAVSQVSASSTSQQPLADSVAKFFETVSAIPVGDVPPMPVAQGAIAKGDIERKTDQPLPQAQPLSYASVAAGQSRQPAKPQVSISPQPLADSVAKLFKTMSSIPAGDVPSMPVVQAAIGQQVESESETDQSVPVTRPNSDASVAAAVLKQPVSHILSTIKEDGTDESPCVLPHPIPTDFANTLIDSANRIGKPWYLDQVEGMIFGDELPSDQIGSEITSEEIDGCVIDYQKRCIRHGKLRSGQPLPSTFKRLSWTFRYFNQQLFNFDRARATREGWADERGRLDFSLFSVDFKVLSDALNIPIRVEYDIDDVRFYQPGFIEKPWGSSQEDNATVYLDVYLALIRGYTDWYAGIVDE